MSALAVNLFAQFAEDPPQGGRYGASFGAGASTARSPGPLGQNPAYPVASAPEAEGPPPPFAFQASWHRPFGLADLGSAEAGVQGALPLGSGARALGLGLAYRHFTAADLYLERTAEAALAYAEGRTRCGAALLYREAVFSGYPRQGLPGDAFGATCRLLPGLAAGGFARNILSHRLGPASIDRVYQAGLSIHPQTVTEGTPPAFSQALDLDFRKVEKRPLRLLAAHRIGFQGLIEAVFALANHPFELGLGLSLALPASSSRPWRASLHEGLRRHPDLGMGFFHGLGLVRAGPAR